MHIFIGHTYLLKRKREKFMELIFQKEEKHPGVHLQGSWRGDRGNFPFKRQESYNQNLRTSEIEGTSEAI